MRIHDIEIYGSKQIRAFIKYLEVVADVHEQQEELQKQWQGNAIVGSQIGGLNTAGLASAAMTPEYYAKVRAQADVEKAAALAQDDSKAQDTN
jgi:hypothetical protein